MITDGIAWGKTQIGKPYCTDWNKRFGPDCYDCSGLVTQVLIYAGMASGALPTNSADMARWLLKHPEYRLSRAAARATPGAITIFGGVDGYGAKGHVEISLGDGSNLGSTGGHGVDVKSFDRLLWSDYMLAPGVQYSSVIPSQPVIPTSIGEEEMILVRGDKTPEVWLINGPWKTHVTAATYPQWLFFCAGRPGAVDPTTHREWVLPQAMVDIVKNVASS